MFLGDFHIHSTFSDGKLTIPEIVDLYGTLGFGAIAITDHLCDSESLIGLSSRHLGLTLTEATFPLYINIIRHEAARARKQYNMTLIAGIEFTKNRILSSQSAHFIALGVTSFISPNQPTEAMLERLRSTHCITIAAHPVNTGKMEKQTLHLWQNKERYSAHFDAWEVASGRLLFNDVKSSGLPMIASSDLHSLKHLDSWKTQFEGSRGEENIFNAIRNQNLDFIFYKQGVYHDNDINTGIDLDSLINSDELGDSAIDDQTQIT